MHSWLHVQRMHACAPQQACMRTRARAVRITCRALTVYQEQWRAIASPEVAMHGLLRAPARPLWHSWRRTHTAALHAGIKFHRPASLRCMLGTYERINSETDLLFFIAASAVAALYVRSCTNCTGLNWLFYTLHPSLRPPDPTCALPAPKAPL